MRAWLVMSSLLLLGIGTLGNAAGTAQDVVPTPVSSSVTPEPTPPTITADPATSTAMPTQTDDPATTTAVPWDSHENNYDALHATPIAVGESITGLNFVCPDTDGCADNDWFSFEVKGGRCYRVATTDLAPGIDTNLIVYGSQDDAPPLGGNDDAASGELRSELDVCFPDAQPPATVYLVVGNAGNLAPPPIVGERTYTLSVSLLPPTTPVPATMMPTTTTEPTLMPVTTVPTTMPTGSSQPSTPPATLALPVTPALPQARVATDRLNLRTGPGNTYAIVATYRRGTAVQVRGTDGGGQWLHVEIADGHGGWMLRSLLELDMPPGALPVIGTEGASSAPLGTAAPPTPLPAGDASGATPTMAPTSASPASTTDASAEEAIPGITVEELPPDADPGLAATAAVAARIMLRVCYDRNANRVCDLDEGIAGVTLYVADAQSGQFLGQALTDGSGVGQTMVHAPARGSLLVSVPAFGMSQTVTAEDPQPQPVLLPAKALVPVLLP